jgi:hypothetical protein
MIPLVAILAACAGHVSAHVTAPSTSSSPTATAVAAPSPPLDCSSLFGKEGFFLAPDSSVGGVTLALVPAAGASYCTWVATIWESVTLLVVPQTSVTVPASVCAVSDEGGGDHVSCRFDAVENGYRLSGYIGGPQHATDSEVLASAKPIVSAFGAAAASAVRGGPPAAVPAPIDCAAIDDGSHTFTDHAPDGYLPAAGIGPSLPRADLYRLAGAKECDSGTIRVAVVPGATTALSLASADGGEQVTVPGTDAARFDGDVPAEYGATIMLLRGSTFVQISQGSRSRATQLALCAAVLAALAH